MTGTILLALLPIVLLIGLGAALRRSRFLGEAFWPQAERLGYYVLLPSLFVHGLVTAPLEGIPIGALVTVLVTSTLLVAGLLLAGRRFLNLEGAAFTSVFQGGVRFNNYVGVSVAAGLFGAQGIALAAVANAAIVPTVNILCVLVFARFGALGRPSLAGLLRLLAFNPLVVACLVGIGLKSAGLGLPGGIAPALRALGQASLPLGLLCVGAALDFGTARAWVRPCSWHRGPSSSRCRWRPWRPASPSASTAPPPPRPCCSRPCPRPRPPTSWPGNSGATRP